MWGRVRAEMGHPEPFNLEYLGVGNEQWETETTKENKGNEFYKRFELFEKRLHERYPDLKIVGTVGPTVDSDTHKSAWKWTRENLKKNPNFVYCSDEHFYVSPEWLYRNADVYDSYPRDGGAGGLYGVSIGRCFFGESMFSEKENGSKAALIGLARILEQNTFLMIDCQFHTEHLERMGGRYITWKEYNRLLKEGTER